MENAVNTILNCKDITHYYFIIPISTPFQMFHRRLFPSLYPSGRGHKNKSSSTLIGPPLLARVVREF